MTTNPNSKDANCSKCTVRSRALFGAIGDENIRVTQKYRDKHCHFSKGSILHREQSKIDYAFTLYSGCLILYNDFENGTRQIIRVALPGDFIGFSRNSKGELPYSIQAVTDSKICLFFDTNVSKMIQENHDISKQLINLQLNDAVLCRQRMLSLGQKDSTEALAYLIMELYSRIRVQSPSEFNQATGETFFPLNQSDMADY